MSSSRILKRLSQLEQSTKVEEQKILTTEILDITEDGRLRRTADGKVFEVGADGRAIRDGEDREREGGGVCVILVGTGRPNEVAHQKRIEEAKLALSSAGSLQRKHATAKPQAR